jgi:hypothetical protein
MSKFVPEISCQQADLVVIFLVSIEQQAPFLENTVSRI